MKDKLFSKNMIGLMAAGLIINIAMVYVTAYFHLPLYLDSIGTIIVAVLGGILPGITVGYFSNIVNYICSVSNDPLTLYYGFISVMLAAMVVFLAKKGLYKKISTSIIAVFVLAFIGGGIGSLLTWAMYGLNFGENISSSLVYSIYKKTGCIPFMAQLMGDYCIDLFDKGISIAAAWIFIRLMPQKLLKRFPYGSKYINNQVDVSEDNYKINCRKMSLRGKLTIIIVVSSFVLSITSTLIGMYIHINSNIKSYENSCREITSLLSSLIDGGRISEYIEQGNRDEEYRRICKEIETIQNNITDVENISVFCIQNEKNRQIFSQDQNADTDEKDFSYVVWPKAFQNTILEFQSGNLDDFQILKTADHTMMSIMPLYDQNHSISAYITVVLDLSPAMQSAYGYFIRIISLLFGIGIIIVGYVFWFYEHSILQPIKILLKQTEETAHARMNGQLLRDKVKVTTGDELELLFNNMCAAEDSIIHSDHASQSKTKFLSKMSHEIRTPLNSVIGFSNLAINERKNITKEELLDYMQKIQISGNYLLELVSDVLDISRIEEGRMTVTNEACRLDELVEEIVNSFQGQMKRKNLEFVVDKDYEDIFLYMDNFHTIQILNNLISNAYKYTEEGGVVGLEVHCKQIDQKHVKVQYIVQDTGIGMSEEFQKKIFEPFTQDERGMKMKKQLRGSGLGMSICKNLVELLGGTIELESTVGEGSCFTVTIKYELISRKSGIGLNQPKDYTALAGRKILVVDDLEMNRIVVEKSLSAYQLIFDDAEDGIQAVEKFKASEENEYFAIFMDVQMPEMNGYEATKVIRSIDRKDNNVAIIGMTADAFADDVKKAMESGMDYHTTKPIQVQKVLNILAEIAQKNKI